MGCTAPTLISSAAKHSTPAIKNNPIATIIIGIKNFLIATSYKLFMIDLRYGLVLKFWLHLPYHLWYQVFLSWKVS
jgi:hypothetical protein